jgi:hypothetical protein
LSGIGDVKMKKKDVKKFEKIQAQLEGLYQEITTLTKKSPNDAVNVFKIRFINQVLADALGVLTDKYRPFRDFRTFKEDDVPLNSDVTLILSQYLNCMEKLRDDNIEQEGIGWWWVIDGQVSEVQTAPPGKLRRKK